MGIDLTNIHYNNFREIPYLNGGEDVSSLYISDLKHLKEQITDSDKYLDISNIQNSLAEYYDNNYHKSLDLDQLEEYIADAFVENEKLKKEELENKLSYAIKTENIDRNIKNNKMYNTALQRMVNEDISLDSLDIEKINQSLHNKIRSLEIKQYYDEKMKLQIRILKTVITIFLILLAITLLYKVNILNSHLYIAIIGVGLACTVIFTVGMLFDILIRDDTNFDEYGFISSHHYLNKGDKSYKTSNDTPLYKQPDLISNKCLRVLKDISNN